MSTPTAPNGPVMIGGGELGRCPTRIHHDRFNDAEPASDPVAERRIADGREWERTIIAHILAGTDPNTVSTPGTPMDPRSPAVIDGCVAVAEREALTTEALHAGVPLIVGGRLSSPSRRSVGVPDLLVRLNDGFAPIDVKHHKTLRQTGIPARTTSIDRIDVTDGPDGRFRTGRVNDLLQVAHYWRLLEDIGLANMGHLAGIIGAEPSLTAVWVDLAADDPSILDRHVEALDEAIAVAEAGQIRPETPMIPAIWRADCRSCPWADACRDELEAIDHVSLLPAVGARDAGHLLESGISTTTQMAELEPGAILGRYEVTAEAVLQANARATGSLLHREGADLLLPDASVEIDFDIETYLGTLYLAGLLIHDSHGPSFRPIVDWAGTPAAERRVLLDLFRFLDEIADQGDSVVYHWTGYERKVLNDAALRHGLSLRSAPSVDAWFERHGCDLWSWIKQRFVSPNGYSLKVIAPLCGFQWRDDDPGGAQSELWYLDVLAGDDDQRVRLLEYNEDDVAAQAAIRRWVRAQS